MDSTRGPNRRNTMGTHIVNAYDQRSGGQLKYETPSFPIWKHGFPRWEPQGRPHLVSPGGGRNRRGSGGTDTDQELKTRRPAEIKGRTVPKVKPQCQDNGINNGMSNGRNQSSSCNGLWIPDGHFPKESKRPSVLIVTLYQLGP